METLNVVVVVCIISLDDLVLLNLTIWLIGYLLNVWIELNLLSTSKIDVTSSSWSNLMHALWINLLLALYIHDLVYLLHYDLIINS